jgi:hypothetical protein
VPHERERFFHYGGYLIKANDLQTLNRERYWPTVRIVVQLDEPAVAHLAVHDIQTIEHAIAFGGVLEVTYDACFVPVRIVVSRNLPRSLEHFRTSARAL